jgi:hypothetical protein
MGHDDQFPPSAPSARCQIGQVTFVETHEKGRDAP